MSKQFTVLVSEISKKILIIDNWKLRYNRMRRRVVSWAKTMSAVHERVVYVMITLTYSPEYDWQPNHIREFIIALRKYLKNEIIGYAWVAELQERGAVHYHLMLIVPRGVWLPAKVLTSMWGFGRTNIMEAKQKGWYLVSYLKKAYQKDFSKFPKGIRTFAVYCRDDGYREQLRFLSLKLAERMAYDQDGWQGVREYREQMIGKSEWYAYGHYFTVSGARMITPNPFEFEIVEV